MKKNKKSQEFLAQLRKVPIIQVACEKVAISRQSVYRWRADDKQFQAEMDAALAEGEAFINDMTESQLIVLIKEGSWPAISFWLKHRNKKFRERLEVDVGPIEEEKLTADQEAAVKKALEFGFSRHHDTRHDHQ